MVKFDNNFEFDAKTCETVLNDIGVDALTSVSDIEDIFVYMNDIDANVSSETLKLIDDAMKLLRQASFKLKLASRNIRTSMPVVRESRDMRLKISEEMSETKGKVIADKIARQIDPNAEYAYSEENSVGEYDSDEVVIGKVYFYDTKKYNDDDSIYTDMHNLGFKSKTVPSYEFFYKELPSGDYAYVEFDEESYEGFCVYVLPELLYKGRYE